MSEKIRLDERLWAIVRVLSGCKIAPRRAENVRHRFDLMKVLEDG